MSCGVYLIQPTELIGTNRYKVGCSVKQDLYKRIKTGYLKGTEIIILLKCDNAFETEKKIKKKFNFKFKLIAGKEYYEGNIKEMKKKFINIVYNYKENDIKLLNLDESDNLINKLKQEVNDLKQKIKELNNIKYENSQYRDTNNSKFYLYFNNGNIKYEGNLTNNLPNGKGILYYENSHKKYEGWFINGKKNSLGIYYNIHGNIIYNGNFKNDKYDGYGVAYLPNGKEYYKGSWLNGKTTVNGTFFNKNGIKI